MYLSTTKNKKKTWQNQNKMIFMSSFMTHVHYLRSVLPHSEYLKSVSKHPLVSWLWWCMPEISACGRLKRTSQVQGQPRPSSTPCLRNKASHYKSQFCWVLPDGYSHGFSSFDFEVDTSFLLLFFSASLRVFSNPLGTSICHLVEGGLTRYWRDLAVKTRFSSIV